MHSYMPDTAALPHTVTASLFQVLHVRGGRGHVRAERLLPPLLPAGLTVIKLLYWAQMGIIQVNMLYWQVSRFDTNSQTMAFMRLRLDDRGVWVVGETYRIPRIPEAMKTIAMGEAEVKKDDRVRGRGSEQHTHITYPNIYGISRMLGARWQ